MAWGVHPADVCVADGRGQLRGAVVCDVLPARRQLALRAAAAEAVVADAAVPAPGPPLRQRSAVTRTSTVAADIAVQWQRNSSLGAAYNDLPSGAELGAAGAAPGASASTHH